MARLDIAMLSYIACKNHPRIAIYRVTFAAAGPSNQ
jgi:hypothetical protein